MSWMDSWSRPAKSQATPAPYYLLPGGEATPYCHSCGRVIGQRKQQQDKEKAEVVKYCSSRCRGRKPGKLDREIEGVFLRFLLGKEKEEEEVKVDADAEGEDGTAAEKPKQGSWNTKGNKHQHKTKKVKGDARILVSCSMVEDEVFPHHRDQGDDGSEAEVDEDGHDRPDSSSGSHDQNEEDKASSSSQQYHHPDPDLLHDPASYTDDLRPPLPPNPQPQRNRRRRRPRPHVRPQRHPHPPPQSVSEVNGSVGGEKGRAERTDESEEALRKRLAGQRRAREREMVRCAARRGVAFGFVVAPQEDDGHHHDEDEGVGKAKKGGKKSAKKHHDGEADTKGETKENRRLCEAVMAGKVVEPSFAKGDWSIRWREE
ncbi:hypothetical protein PG993_015288 [Apiospora rasikravindrae]|uniref:Chitinase n=1 Tax=Apiospora rasikravindrae TaxID=990691 RepID=A0ABR1RQ44_9PEZI